MMMVQWKEGESSRLKRESKASKGRRKREGRSDESGGEVNARKTVLSLIKQ